MNMAQRESLDAWITEAPDDSISELAFESALEGNLDEFVKCGHLPGSLDSGDVDEQLADQWPEALHEISQAYGRGDKDALLALAVQIAERRLEIAEEIIAESMKQREAA